MESFLPGENRFMTHDPYTKHPTFSHKQTHAFFNMCVVNLKLLADRNRAENKQAWREKSKKSRKDGPQPGAQAAGQRNGKVSDKQEIVPERGWKTRQSEFRFSV